MRNRAAAALFACALASPAFAQTLQPFAILAGPPSAPVEVEADSMTYGYDKKVLHLEGHVVAKRGAAILRAGSGLYDRDGGKLTLSGGVLGVQGRQVFLADAALVDLNARTAEFRAKAGAGATDTTDMAVLYLKEQTANPDSPKAGKNALVLWGRTVQERPDGSYTAKDVILTPCDCAGEPDYELRADDAVLDKDRARLHGTHLHFPHVTLPLFPLSLPLTNRQWGLLAPQFGFSGVAGFGFAQPLFLPLGDSYDLTLTPGFFTGGRNSAAPGQAVLYGSAIGARNIKGPRLGTEFRYAPAEGTSGSLSFDAFYDADQHQRASPNSDPPIAGEVPSNDGRGLAGVRGVAHLLHRTEKGATAFAVQGTVATDTMVVQDAEPTSVDRFTDFLRTDAGLWRARGATTLGLDATFLQDVRILDANEPDRRLFGSERRSTFQRLPSAFAQVAPEPLGPFSFSLEASAAQFAPFAGPDANERSTGFAPTDLGGPSAQPQNDGDLSRAPGLRADFAPRFGWSLQRAPFDLRLDLGGRADGYVLYGYPDRDHARAYGDAFVLLGLPLERRFGATLHRIEPQVELRAVTPSLLAGGPPIGDPADAGGARYARAVASAQQTVFPGAATPAGAASGVPSARRSYDEVDGAAPSTGEVEAVFSLAQALWAKSGKTAVRWLRLDLQQDVLFGSGGGGRRLGEGSATFGLQYAFAVLNGIVRYDWDLAALSTISAGAGLHDARGDEIHGSLLLLRGASSERLRAGIDELFAAAQLAALPGSLVGSVGGGASAALPGNLRLGYDGSKFISTSNTIAPGQADMVHALSLAYDTPCHCATVALGVAQPFHGGTRIGPPSVHFVLDLKSLGSFATF